MNGVLYRPAKVDRNGDPVDADGNVVRVGADGTLVGAVIRLILGAASTGDAGVRGTTFNTDGLIGFPTNGLLPKPGDTLVTSDGVKYRIGVGQWGRVHSLTGSASTARYRWHEATALV